MKVSIVIPVYNTEKYLNECIESVLNQTYKKIEVIAVNDGSTDDSLKILHNYSDRIKIICKSNGGTSSALNLGIKKMTGQWFKWVSADDVLYPNAIEELINETEKTSDNKNTIFYGNYDIINSNSKIIKQFIEPDYNNLSVFDFNVLLLDHHIGNGTTSLIHKSAFEKYGYFNESIGFREDYELWLRFCLLYNCRLHLVPKVLAKYRVHETQVSKKEIENALKNVEMIRNTVLEKLDSENRDKYQLALKQFKKKKPYSIKTRYAVRDMMIRLFPKSASNNILKIYFERIKNRKD